MIYITLQIVIIIQSFKARVEYFSFRMYDRSLSTLPHTVKYVYVAELITNHKKTIQICSGC